MISENICKTGEYADAVAFKAECSCGGPDHSQSLFVEIEYDQVTLKLYSTIEANVYCSSTYNYFDEINKGHYLKAFFHWIRHSFYMFREKCRLTKKLWLDGYVTAENDFMFKNNASIDAYVEAIKTAQEKLNRKIKQQYE